MTIYDMLRRSRYAGSAEHADIMKSHLANPDCIKIDVQNVARDVTSAVAASSDLRVLCASLSYAVPPFERTWTESSLPPEIGGRAAGAYWRRFPHENGDKIRSFENNSAPQDFGNGLKVDFTFSAKADYRDYQHKMYAYLGWIEGEAKKIRPEVTAETRPVYATDEDDDDVFHYIDTASSRVHIGADNEKLENQRVAIVGVGGTGSYVLDFVAKTRVAEIRIFDGDSFLMSALMSDLIEEKITPGVGNAVCNAGGKLLKVVELQAKYGRAGDGSPDKVLQLAGPEVTTDNLIAGAA